jgi:hypothetical protein
MHRIVRQLTFAMRVLLVLRLGLFPKLLLKLFSKLTWCVTPASHPPKPFYN